MAISIAELIGSFNEAWSGKTELLDAVVTDDWDDIPLAPGQKPGRAGLRATIEGINKAFSDFRFVTEEIIDARGEDGNGMVGVRSTMRGVHTGEFFGIAPADGARDRRRSPERRVRCSAGAPGRAAKPASSGARWMLRLSTPRPGARTAPGG